MAKPILYINAVIHTGVTESESFSCMLVKNRRIAGLFHEKPESSRYAREVDLRGEHVFPCLVDPHVHLSSTVALMGAGFEACRITKNGIEPNCFAGLERRVREYAAKCSPKQPLVITGCIPSALKERRLPTREELDDWTQSRAAVIYTIDGHSSSNSSAMLKLLGIDPCGHSGLLSGEEHEQVQGKVNSIVARSLTLSALARGSARFQNACAEYGISCVGALEGSAGAKNDLSAKLGVLLARHMKTAVRVYFQYIDVQRVQKLKHLQRTPRIGGCGEWEMDGAVGSHSAAFPQPYADSKQTADCYCTQEFVDARVAEAHAAGFQIASHAIGPLAIRRIVTALNKLPQGTFHRVEHGEFALPEELESFCTGRFAVVAQPGYSWVDKRFLHSYEQYLEKGILDNMRFASPLRSGAVICGSSDSPVQSLDPYIQLRGMTEFYVPSESVTPYEAFCCYTKNSARALGELNERGTLEEGKLADFFTAKNNLFELSPDALSDFRPSAVYYGGRAYRPLRGSVRELLRMLLAPPHRV